MRGQGNKTKTKEKAQQKVSPGKSLSNGFDQESIEWFQPQASMDNSTGMMAEANMFVESGLATSKPIAKQASGLGNSVVASPAAKGTPVGGAIDPALTPETVVKAREKDASELVPESTTKEVASEMKDQMQDVSTEAAKETSSATNADTQSAAAKLATASPTKNESTTKESEELDKEISGDLETETAMDSQSASSDTGSASSETSDAGAGSAATPPAVQSNPNVLTPADLAKPETKENPMKATENVEAKSFNPSESDGGAEVAGEGGGRTINIPKPEFDGMAEKFQGDMVASKGAVGMMLEKESQQAFDQKQNSISKLSKDQKKTKSAGAKIAEAQAAVQETQEDKNAEMNSAQVETVDKLEKPKADKSEAKKTLNEGKKKLNDKIKTPEDVENLKNGGGNFIKANVAGVVSSQVSEVSDTFSAIDTEKTGSKAEAPKQAKSLPAKEKPRKTAKLDLGKDLVPETPKDQTEFVNQSNQEADNLWAKEGLDQPGFKEEIEKVDSGPLGEANAEKGNLKAQSETGQAELDEFQQGQHDQVNQDLQKEEQKGRKDMEGERGRGLNQAGKEQTKAKTGLEKKREEVTTHINGIYETANTNVKSKLDNLEISAMASFDKKQDAATVAFEKNVDKEINAFKYKRYYGPDGSTLAAAWDWLVGIDDLPEVKRIFERNRDRFIKALDQAIEQITADNKKVIDECKLEVENAKLTIDKYILTLGKDVKDVALKAKKDVNAKLDKLTDSINAKEQELKEKLAAKREEAIKAIDEKIEKMKEAMSGALSKLGNLILDGLMAFFKWALTAAGKSPDEIMGIVNKGKTVITAIVTDPIGFFGNLGTAVGNGIGQFSDNIWTHLLNGLVNWLTGAVGGEVHIPEKFDLMGVGQMAASILGLDYNNLRIKLARYVPESIISAAETGFEVVMQIKEKGIAGMWDDIKAKFAEIDIVQLAIDGLMGWATVQIVKKATIKLLSMLNPVGAIVQAILLLFDTVMFFIENWQRILDFVNSVFESIGNIAMGKLGPAANYIEKMMALTIPMLMSFLARFLGLGGIAKQIKDIIKKVKKPIDNAIDKAMSWIAKKVRKWFGGKKGGKKKSKVQDDKDNKKEEKEDKNSSETKKKKKAEVRKGLAYLHQKEKSLDKDNDGDLSREDAEKAARKTKSKYKVFQWIKVVPKGKKWGYQYKYNPTETVTGAKQDDDKKVSAAVLNNNKIGNHKEVEITEKRSGKQKVGYKAKVGKSGKGIIVGNKGSGNKYITTRKEKKDYKSEFAKLNKMGNVKARRDHIQSSGDGQSLEDKIKTYDMILTKAGKKNSVKKPKGDLTDKNVSQYRRDMVDVVAKAYGKNLKKLDTEILHGSLTGKVGNKILGEIFEKWIAFNVKGVSGKEVVFADSRGTVLRRADGYMKTNTLVEMKSISTGPSAEHKKQMTDYANVLNSKTKGYEAGSKAKKSVGPFNTMNYYFSNEEAASMWAKDLKVAFRGLRIYIYVGQKIWTEPKTNSAGI